MIIRSYKDSDYEQVAANLKEATLFNPELDTAKILNEKIIANPGSILVADADGEILGSIYIIFDKWQSLLFRLAVKEIYRKRGVGKLLIETAESKLRDFGAHSISGTIRENHPHLERYYEKLGYELSQIKHRYIHKKLN